MNRQEKGHVNLQLRGLMKVPEMERCRCTEKKYISTSRVANQLISAMTSLNASEGDYRRFWKFLTLPPVSRTYYTRGRSLALEFSRKIWGKQERLYQQLAQQLDDRDLETDASYSHRRSAEHCFVTYTSKHHLIVMSAVGSRKKLQLSSQGLELELTTRGLLLPFGSRNPP